MKKRSVKIAGHATSVSLEDAFWDELQAIAKTRQMTLTGLIEDIDKNNRGNLSSALRLYVLQTLKKQIQKA